MSGNPYQAPMAKPMPLSPGTSGGIWSDGKLLVVHKNAELPPVCVKTNETAERNIRRTFYWHPGLVYLLILLHIFIYLIAALIIRKSHKLQVPLSAEAISKRRVRILIGWIVAILGIVIIVFGFFTMIESRNVDTTIAIAVTSVITGFVTLIAGAIIGSRAASILRPKKITDHATWFKGAHPDYVSRFPVIPPHPDH